MIKSRNKVNGASWTRDASSYLIVLFWSRFLLNWLHFAPAFRGRLKLHTRVDAIFQIFVKTKNRFITAYRLQYKCAILKLFKIVKAPNPSQLKPKVRSLYRRREPYFAFFFFFLIWIICAGWCLPSTLHRRTTWHNPGQWQRDLGAPVRVRVAVLPGNQYLLFSVSRLFKKEPQASMLDAVLWQRHCFSVLAGLTRRWCSSTTTAAVPMKWVRIWRVLLVATLLRISVGISWGTPRLWHPARLTRPVTCPPPPLASRWSSAVRALQPRTHPARPCHMGISGAATTLVECLITAA